MTLTVAPSGRTARVVTSGLLLVALASCGNDSDAAETAMPVATSMAEADPSTEASPSAEATPSSSPRPVGTETSGPTKLESPSTKATRGLATAETVDTPTLPPVKPSETATADSGISIALKSWASVTTPAGAPGEIGGPGVAVTLRVANQSSQQIDLNNVVVDLQYGKDRVPALRADRDPTKPFSGQLAPGKAATATYAFRLDESDRGRVRMYVRLNGEAPIAVFRGSLSP